MPQLAPSQGPASVWPCTEVTVFFNDTATTEIYTLSLHDALPICYRGPLRTPGLVLPRRRRERRRNRAVRVGRSEEHTSELQSPCNIVCRLLLEKKQGPWFWLDVRGLLMFVQKRHRLPRCANKLHN